MVKILSEKPHWRASNTVALACACAMAAFIFYMSSIPGSGLPRNLGFWTVVAHFCEYAALAALVALAVRGKTRSLWAIVGVSVLVCSLYGASDEFHQLFVPGRSSDVVDWITDTCGALVGSYLITRLATALESRKM